MSRPKAGQNLAKDVEKKPAVKPKSYILPETLRQAIIQALLNSLPTQLSVLEVNKMCNALSQLKEKE